MNNSSENINLDITYKILRHIIKSKGFITISVSGTCMHPILINSEIITIVYKPFSLLKKGDIIATYKNNCFKIHRVIKKNNNSVITKGDYSCMADSNINETDYLGYWGRSILGELGATISNFQNIIYTKYEMKNNELIRKAFCFLIKLNMKINSFALVLKAASHHHRVQRNRR